MLELFDPSDESGMLLFQLSYPLVRLMERRGGQPLPLEFLVIAIWLFRKGQQTGDAGIAIITVRYLFKLMGK
jgi:hypothetical protein